MQPPDAVLAEQQSVVMRMPYKGVGADLLPVMSQAVAYGNEILYTLYSSCPSTSSSRSSSSSSSGVCRPVNYKAETEEVLLRLEQCMECSGIAHKKLLTGVRVYLRNIEEGLSGFTQAWNSWVDHGSAPVLTILQGSGPFCAAGIVLEARVYTGP